MARLGVGILGSGSVVQGIHLPTLARLPDLFDVRHLMDVDEYAVTAVAHRIGAKWSTSVDDLLADDGVDVVAVCTPHRFHAEQVIAACEAGKSAVLCEKPFAVTHDEARRIGEVSRATGVPVIVGAMHTYDPAWIAVRAAWGDLPEQASFIRSSIILPTNDRFEAWATEVASPAVLPQRDVSTADARASVISARLLGLAIHDLPLVRTFLPQWRELEVVSADLLDPAGYVVMIRAGDRLAQIVGSFRSHWLPEWRFEVTASSAALAIEFPPSYVLAGSGSASLHSVGEQRTFGGSDATGYEGEWQRLHQLATGADFDERELDGLIDDLSFAVLIADRAGEHLRSAR